jgi:O-antigen/teichoic acid export membrane protein
LPTNLWRGMAAFGGAEIVTRIVRVFTTLVIARQLAPAIVGEAALALTLFELIRVLWGIGIGQRIIAADADELPAVCNLAHGLFWRWAAVLMAVQLLAAALLWLGFGQSVAAAMLAVLALVYPLMPGGLVQCHLAMREGRHGALARTAAAQAIADQLLTAALLLAWPNPWAVTLPKLLTAPIWLVMTRRSRPWLPDPTAGKAAMPGLIRFGAGTLAADALGALRQNGDNLIIAATMGSVALGSYYFAFNAGLGIVTALANALGTVILPILGRAEAGAARAQALRSVLIGAALLFVPLVAAQSLLAPFYVPLLFGAHWAFAAPLVGLLCVAGLAHLVGVIASAWLRANGDAAADARRSLLACVATLAGLWLGSLSGSLAGAAGGLVAGSLAAAAITRFTALRPGFGRGTPFLLSKETPA